MIFSQIGGFFMILYKNELYSSDTVRISPDDRGYYFGDGIYEVFRIYGGILFEKEAHYARLLRTAEAVRIPLPHPLPDLDRKLDELTATSGIDTGTLYVQITRGEAKRAHPFPQQTEPVLYAYCQSLPRPIATMQTGIAAVTVPDIRWLRCDLKTLNLLPNVLAKQEALDRGVQESILHRDGTVTECSASNLMIVKDGHIFTHPANHLILHGITREVVLRLAKQCGIPAYEEAFTIERLYDADEAFLTGTTVEVTPVVTVDGKRIGTGEPGNVVRRLQEAFELAITRG